MCRQEASGVADISRVFTGDPAGVWDLSVGFLEVPLPWKVKSKIRDKPCCKLRQVFAGVHFPELDGHTGHMA